MTGKTAAQLEARRERLTAQLATARAAVADAERELTAALVEERPTKAKASEVEALRVRAAALARAVDELGPAVDEARRREAEAERAKRLREAERVHRTLLEHAARVDGALASLEAEWARYLETERLLRGRLSECGVRLPGRPALAKAQKALFAGAPRLSTDLGLPRTYAHHGRPLADQARAAMREPEPEPVDDDPLELPTTEATT